MAFFDKLGSTFKNIGDKTGDAIKTSKLNGKINAEKKAIDEDYQKIGEFVYNQYAAGEAVAPGLAEYIESVDAHKQTIADLEAEIEALNEEDAPAEAPKEEPVAEATPVAEAQPADGLVCGACGAKNAPGTKFCGECGGKLEAPKPGPRFCTNCGAKVEAGLRFCGECGNKM